MPPVNTTRMTFDDEFNSFSASDSGVGTTWQTRLPYGGSAAYTLAGNNEDEYYSDPTSDGTNPFSINNGVLSITAAPGWNPLGLDYDSGAITTINSFSQEYGYFEVRAELPAGQGLWPAFWMLPASLDYTSELDVFEQIGSQPTDIFSTVHGSTNGQWWVDSQEIQNIATSTGFHTYGVDWEPNTTTFYIDGQETASMPTPASMDTPDFLLLNLAVGGNGSWPGAPDNSTQFPATMQIDYVRAYATANTTYVGGSAAIPASSSSAVTSSDAVSSSVSVGSGPDTINAAISEDAWQGDAQFLITVDGQQVGGTQTATASHAAGQSQNFAISGDWGSGQHTLGIQFINDAYGGSPSMDRNLYVGAVSYDGTPSSSPPAALMSDGTADFTLGTPSGSSSSSPALVLQMSEDAWQGNAQYTVAVDGVQEGGVMTATASHAAGQTQDVTIASDLMPGWHEVAVSFINDAYGGSPSMDRNLYVDGASYGGTPIAGAASTLLNDNTNYFGFMVPS
jgi:beta-glucanase (GH16 family)